MSSAVGGGYANVWNRPELHAQPDPIDNIVEPHNAWIVSRLSPWLANIDTNLP